MHVLCTVQARDLVLGWAVWASHADSSVILRCAGPGCVGEPCRYSSHVILCAGPGCMDHAASSQAPLGVHLLLRAGSVAIKLCVECIAPI